MGRREGTRDHGLNKSPLRVKTSYGVLSWKVNVMIFFKKREKKKHKARLYHTCIATETKRCKTDANGKSTL